jgi:hypothetical protein
MASMRWILPVTVLKTKPVRLDLEQDQRPHAGEVEDCVVQRLRLLLHRLAVDPLPGLGVVLDLDGQVAARGLHEERVQHVEVREAAADHLLAPRAGPLEVEGRGERQVALAAGVQVLRLARRRHRPAEHPHVRAALADLEGGQQLAACHVELEQAGVLVVGVELVEVADGGGVAQKGAGRVDRLHAVALRALHQPVQAEDVRHAGGGLQPQEDVVPEQQQPAHGDDVPADAVVLGVDAQAPDHLQPAVAELGQPLLVERPRDLPDARALLAQAAAQDLVRSALRDRLVHGRTGGRFLLGRGLLAHRTHLDSGLNDRGRPAPPALIRVGRPVRPWARPARTPPA